MSRWWKGVALGAAYLALTGVSQAQQQIPTPVGAARMPEPLPAGQSPPPKPYLVEGPIGPLQAPPGPGPELDLPSGHSSAFQTENYTTESAAFFSAGAQFLRRQQLGGGVLAVFDPTGFDVGIQGRGTGIAQQLTDISPNMNPGVRATLGYLWGSESIELSGFTIFQKTASTETVAPGRIDSFFTNPPLGFEGNVGLWTQADLLNTGFTGSLINAELNYRVWNAAINHVELILGVRYLQARETLSIFTDDDGATFRDLNGNPDPTRQATYAVAVRNNIIAPQIGGEYATPIPFRRLGWIWLGGNAKAAAGVNLINGNLRLTRGDGFSGFNTRYNTTTFGQIYEGGAFVDFHLLERCRVRAGYNALFLAGVATSADQINFDLSNPNSRHESNGTIFYHGPMVELQLLW